MSVSTFYIFFGIVGSIIKGTIIRYQAHQLLPIVLLQVVLESCTRAHEILARYNHKDCKSYDFAVKRDNPMKHTPAHFNEENSPVGALDADCESTPAIVNCVDVTTNLLQHEGMRTPLISSFDLIVIAGAPGSGKSTVCRLLQPELDGPLIELGRLREFHLNRAWTNTSSLEEEMAFENLVGIVRNYFRHGYKNVLVTDLNDSRVQQIPGLFADVRSIQGFPMLGRPNGVPQRLGIPGNQKVTSAELREKNFHSGTRWMSFPFWNKQENQLSLWPQQYKCYFNRWCFFAAIDGRRASRSFSVSFHNYRPCSPELRGNSLQYVKSISASSQS